MRDWIFIAFPVLIAFICPAVGSGQMLVEEPGVTQMMEQFIEFNRTHQKVRGWRVQVIVTTDRRQVEAIRKRFETSYPEYPAIFSHKNPFYHLKTGAFLTQADARPFLVKLQEEFSEAFLVADEIDLSEVLVYLKDL